MTRYQRRKSQGLCMQCSTPLEDTSYANCPKCREYQRIKKQESYQRNSAKFKTQEQKAIRNQRNADIRKEAITHYGGICVCCNETHYAYLELDHIDGGGTKHRYSYGTSSTSYYRGLKRDGWPELLQVLCANCHRAKTNKLGCTHS